MQRTLLRFDLSPIFSTSPKLTAPSRYSTFSTTTDEIGYAQGIPLSYPYLLAFITFPICAFKNWLNVIQLINAAKALAEVDKDDRQENGATVPSLTPLRPKRSTAGKRKPFDG
jgi:hypothetical protein